MTTVVQAAHRFVTERARLGEISGLTPRTYRIILSRFAREIGDPDVRRVTSHTIRRWATSREVRPSTVRSNLIVIRAFFGWAETVRLVAKNPAVGIADPRVPNGIPRALHRDEVVCLLAACADARLRLIALLMVHEGLRACEVARLSSYDIDMARRSAEIIGKGGKRRAVPLCPETWEALEAYGIRPGPVIRNERDARVGITADHLSALMSRLFADAGLKHGPYDGRSGHALRHTCAVAYLEDGASIAEVRDLLGHESLAVTDKYSRSAYSLERLRLVGAGRRYG